MRHAKITTESGYRWETDINGTDQSICEYFLGNEFETNGDPEGPEVFSKAVKVEIDGETFRLSDLGGFCPECGKLLHYKSSDTGSGVQYFDVDRNKLCRGNVYKHSECV